MSDEITSDPETMDGVPVFSGTRVPIQALADTLRHGHTIDRFLGDYPTVNRDQVLAALARLGHLQAEGDEDSPR